MANKTKYDIHNLIFKELARKAHSGDLNILDFTIFDILFNNYASRKCDSYFTLDINHLNREHLAPLDIHIDNSAIVDSINRWFDVSLSLRQKKPNFSLTIHPLMGWVRQDKAELTISAYWDFPMVQFYESHYWQDSEYAQTH